MKVQNAYDAFQTWVLEKFVDGSATLPSEEVAKADYNEKETKAFALLCEHLTDAQPTHIQYCDNVRSAWEVLCVLEITWKQARNESFKVHEMEQLY